MHTKCINYDSEDTMAEDRSKAYTNTGVDIHAGNELVQRIKKDVASTHNHCVLSDIGGFGGLYRPDLSGLEDPILIGATDGVGTKLKLAIDFNKHDTVGIDLVAMSVNDILVQGAKPLFFLDYYATSKLNVEETQQVIAGIAEGCRQSGCALLGGETAEMPGMYAQGDYDLAGFCVGLVDNSKLVDGSSISVGDVILGFPSSGVHSNGFSLVRKVLADSGLKKDDIFPGTNETVAEVLLKPTIIYVEMLKNIMRDFNIKGMVHITGGGFYDNIPRVLPEQVIANIEFGTWDMLPVFEWLKKEGDMAWEEMLQIFNCGIGYVLIVNESDGEDIQNRFKALDQKVWKIGTIEKRPNAETEQVSIKF